MINKVEIWKDIDYLSNHYQVSNYGRVRSIYKNGKMLILSLNKHREGYLYAQLFHNGKIKPIGVHRLVAKAFIPNPNNLPQVNHKDEDKTNNNVDNLEWCERKYNMNYGTRKEIFSEKMKELMKNEEYKMNIIKQHYRPIICYDLDGNLIKEYECIKNAALDGHNIGAIGECLRGKNKKHHNLIWKYKTIKNNTST